MISMTHLIWYDAPMSLDGMYDSLPINTEVSGELAHKILRLELHIEQVIIHLRSLNGHHAEAERVRCALLEMLLQLRAYKEQQEREEAASTCASGEVKKLLMTGERC